MSILGATQTHLDLLIEARRENEGSTKYQEPWTARMNRHDGIVRENTNLYVVSIRCGSQYQDVVCVVDNLIEKDAEACMVLYSRICDCVNACAGITARALKAGVVEGLLTATLTLKNFHMPEGITKENATWMGVRIWERRP